MSNQNSVAYSIHETCEVVTAEAITDLRGNIIVALIFVNFRCDFHLHQTNPLLALLLSEVVSFLKYYC